MQWNHAGLPQPFANDCKWFPGRSRIRPDSGIGIDANKCPQRYPRQTDYSATLAQFLKLLCRDLLLRRVGVIGVQEQVGVDDGHRCRSPSPYSDNDSKLSPITSPPATWIACVYRYVIRRGKLELRRLSCASCHTRVMRDGTTVKGAQGNFAFDAARLIVVGSKILKRPGSRIEGGHQGVLDSGLAGEL